MIYLVSIGSIWLISGFLINNNLQAQVAKQFEVKAGEIASEVIPFQDQYRFAEFREGKVMYTDGTSAPVKLNYNLLSGQMQFIDPKGDTSTLVNEYTLKRVQIGQTLFYNDYKQGYVEVVESYPALKLGSKHIWQQVVKENAGDTGYGTSAGPTTAVTSVRSPNTSQKIPTDIILVKKVSYFIIDQNERIYPATKNVLLKIGKKHKKVIEKFLKDESIDFKKEEDLKKLLAFYTGLV